MQISKNLRFEILQRDFYTCQYCGASAPTVTLHVDHILPRSAGGSNDRSNLITACLECNLGKAAAIIDPHTEEIPTTPSWIRGADKSTLLRDTTVVGFAKDRIAELMDLQRDELRILILLPFLTGNARLGLTSRSQISDISRLAPERVLPAIWGLHKKGYIDVHHALGGDRLYVKILDDSLFAWEGGESHGA